MTGCYRYPGRDCVPRESGVGDPVCLHCTCPISPRSRFVPDDTDAMIRAQKAKAAVRRRDALAALRATPGGHFLRTQEKTNP
jgi:hypothetical protein